MHIDLKPLDLAAGPRRCGDAGTELVWWVFVTAVLCALPFTVWEFKKQHWRIHWQGWFIGGLFVLLSLPISAYEVAMHLEYWSQPALQKHVIRILLMVPIYAVDSWFALRFMDARFFITPVRECYEAFVIYNFYRYLVTYLEINVGNVEDIIERKPQQPHLWPFNLILSPWPMGWKYSWECKKGIYNYVILRPLTSIVALIARKTQVYDEGQFSLTNVWTYTAAINNISQAWAVYCLIMFGMVLHDELAPLKPLWKFITIKLVVFFSFWQGFVIEVMIWFKIIRLKGSWTIYDSKDIASGLQDFLVCVECFGYAILFAQAFPPRDYMTDMPKGFLNNLVQMLDVRDVVVDLTDNVVEDFQTATTNVVHASNQAVALPGHALKTWLKKGKPWFKGGGPAGRRGRGSSDEDDAGNQQLSLLDGGDLRSLPSDQPGSSRAAGSAGQLDGEDGDLGGEGDAGVSGLGPLVSDVPGPLGGPSSAVALRPASSMGRAARTDDKFS